jgi:hypothetical protein
VVNVQLDAGGNVTFQPIQIFTNGTNPPGPPFTVLAPPYGGKPYRP